MQTFVLIVVLTVWAAVVLWRLWRTGEAPDPITWGIPGALWVLLHPRKPGTNTEPTEPGDTP